MLPELALIGYPPEDLVLRPSVVDACHAAIDCLVRESHNAPALIATTPWREDGRVYNAAIVIDKGTTTRRFKSDLPNYGVFDEKRVFAPGPMPEPVNFRGIAIGVPVCEDIWTPAVTAHLARAGAEFFIVPNGSPFETGKFPTRIELARARARETHRALVYVNQIGGQDELVFDGRSFVLNRSGDLVRARWPAGRKRSSSTRWTRADDGWTCEPGRVEPPGEQLADTYSALIVGLRDYVDKNGFPGIVLGLSGGVDSALSAAVGCRCARARACARRPAAVAVHRPGEHGGSAACRRPAWHSPADDADRAGDDERRGDAGAGVRRAAARRHRRKSPGADSRPSADGALEQVRTRCC